MTRIVKSRLAASMPGAHLPGACLPGVCLVAACLFGAAGCAQPVPFAPVDPVNTAFDGSYKGTLRLIKIAAGAADMRRLCEVRPGMAIQVANGILTYSFRLENYPGQPQARYTALIYPGGELVGSSERGGDVRGQIVGDQIAGRIDSIGCYYEFTARKV